MKFKITVKTPGQPDVVIEGQSEVSPKEFTAHLSNQVIATEQFLERITGKRFHIDAVDSHD
jgi:hypothetical protein